MSNLYEFPKIIWFVKYWFKIMSMLENIDLGAMSKIYWKISILSCVSDVNLEEVPGIAPGIL